MSYCTQHAIQILSEEKKKLSDYVKLYEVLAEKVNEDFNKNYFPFIFKENDSCIIDINWNYGFGRDWGWFRDDMVNLSKEADVELKCAWQGEEDGDNGFLHVKSGKVLEEKKLTKENLKWFLSVYKVR